MAKSSAAPATPKWAVEPEEKIGEYHVAGRGPTILLDGNAVARIPSGSSKSAQREAAANAEFRHFQQRAQCLVQCLVSVAGADYKLRKKTR